MSKLKTVEIQLPPLRPFQQEILRAGQSHRYRVAAVGRRSGKTYVAALECVMRAADGQTVWWVAPEYGTTAEAGYQELQRLCLPLVGPDNWGKKDKIFRFLGGGSIQVKTASSPNNLRGPGIDFVVFDEAAFIFSEAWTSSVRPMLFGRGADRQGGSALFISTPFGRNWFHALYGQGQSDSSDYDAWWSIRVSTAQARPELAREIAEAKVDTPKEEFAREYEASFIDSALSVFKNIHEVATVPFSEHAKPEPGHVYVFGVDVAYRNDFNTIAVLDATANRFVWMDRFPGTGFEAVTTDRLGDAIARWQPQQINVEQNNAIGLITEWENRGWPVTSWHAGTGENGKAVVVNKYARDIEAGRVRLLDHPIVIDEHESYQLLNITANGTQQFGAPKNKNDDTVSAGYIAYAAVHNATPVSKVLSVPGGSPRGLNSRRQLPRPSRRISRKRPF